MFASTEFGLSYLLEWVAIPVFVWFTVRYVYQRGFGSYFPSLKQLMANRERAIKEQLEAGEDAKREAEKLLAERRAAFEKAKTDAESIVSQAQRNAERFVAQGRQRAEEEYQHALRRADVAIELALTQAREELLAKVGTAVVSAASKVVAVELDTINHHRLIEEAISAAEAEAAS
jgi:ATP synthase F0 subunit b